MIGRKLVSHAKRIMVKLGSAVVTRSSGSGIALGRTANVIEQLCHLQASGREVILVSSGAVAAGRHLLHSGRRLIEDLPIPSRPMPPVHCQVEADVQLRAGRWEVATAQECASVGQSSLMALYDAMFKLYGIQSGQVLITTAGLLDREPRTSTCKTVNRLVSRGILPVINENDALLPLPHEGDGSIGIPVTDNDAIASILAKELKCEALLLLSNVDGVFTGDPDDPSAKLLSEITPSTAKDIQFRGSSSAGRGGMASKVTSAVYAAEAGVNVIIGNGLKFRSILDIIDGKDVGTIVWRP